MRAAAVAFVLIIGAAVVLWYGNTLNSWVLGGLIGGLAAILLSIPITLTLFSYLARRHDERQKAEAQEEASLARFQAYQEEPVDVFESAAYELPEGDEWEEGNSRYQIAQYKPRAGAREYQASRARNLPVPVSPRLPAARQMPSPPSTTHQRVTDYTLARQRASAEEQRFSQEAPRERNKPARRNSNNPGFYGHQSKTTRGLHQTAALRAARMEALQKSADTFLYSHPSRQVPGERDVDSGSLPAFPSSQRPPARQYRPARTVEGSSSPSRSGHLLPSHNEQAAFQNTDHLPETGPQRANPTGDPQTDKIAGRYPSTGPMRMQPQTGQITRQPHIDPQPRNPEIITGSLKHPMVRRAPYLYEDDALREELAQQLEQPSVRRSSLYDRDDDEI